MNSPVVTCEKLFTDFPFAHRQPNHSGHCRLIHGHNWAFKFVFAAKQKDENGFVIDFGDLKWLRNWLNFMFDHTLVLNQDDPSLEFFVDTLTSKNTFAEIRVVPNCGAEGLAQFLFESVNLMLFNHTEGRVFLASVVVFEDLKNSATYFEKEACCS